MSAPDWKHVLPVPLPGGRLHEAWFTSFERPDASLLVEHLLPSLLGMSHSIIQEPLGRTLFFGELGMTLEPFRGRLTAVSSLSRNGDRSTHYPWLWRYVDHFTVGANGFAIQHSKLWAFHWKTGHEDALELHVSSTNLTDSAFKAQIQSGWQMRVTLGEPSADNRRSWGELIAFLEALGDASGEHSASRFKRLCSLLERVECPRGVTFISSIPARTSAARQLERFTPYEIHLVTPTVGDWQSKSLAAWCNDVGLAPTKVHLKWISQKHPWAQASGWKLSTRACSALMAQGVRLECLPRKIRFTEDHLAGDTRWAHAKLYLLLCPRRKIRLLVTSANWSLSAWGAGRTPPRNFELGVVLETEWRYLATVVEEFSPPETVPYCDDRSDTNEPAPSLYWADSEWDGVCVCLYARSHDANTPITVAATFSDGTEKGSFLTNGFASIPWNASDPTPTTARFTQGTEILTVDVRDMRSLSEFVRTPLPEVDIDVAQSIREAFLLQRYGGQAVEPESISELTTARPTSSSAAPTADYSVQAWTEAREAFELVDCWRAALIDAKSRGEMLDQVLLDGEALRNLFARRDTVASKLAAEEIGWYLDEEA